jgi:hypothetical protein
LALRGAYFDDYVEITRRQHGIMAELIDLINVNKD